MLAIVIPYYKPDFFRQTLQSLAEQTNRNFKVYIGDDASPVRPTALLDQFRDSFEISYTRFEENLGGKSLVAQWHRCLNLTADEEWVMVLCDDDLLEPNCIAAFYEKVTTADSAGIDVIRYATVVVDAYGTKVSEVYKHPVLETSTDFLLRKLSGGTRSSLSEFVFRRKKLQETGFRELPLAWFSDVLALLEVSNFGMMLTLNEAVVHFRHSALNITGRKEDLPVKARATFLFFFGLLDRHADRFAPGQQQILYKSLEKAFLNNKKNGYFWRVMVRHYARRGQLRSLLAVFVKALGMLFKKV